MKIRDFHDKAYFDFADGVYRWESNGFIPHDNTLEAAAISDEIRAHCNEKREAETNEKLIECLTLISKAAARGDK